MTNAAAVVGLTWDGYDVQRSDLDVFLEITEGLDELPELRPYRHVIPFRHGQRSDMPYAHGRPLVLTGLISGPSATERAGYRGYVDEVKQAFSPFRTEPGILVATLEDGTVRWISAMPLDLRPASIVPGASKVSIELIADDPFWYSAYGTLDMDDGVEMDDDELMDSGGEIVVTSPTTEVTFDSQGTADVERIRVRFVGASGGSVGIENLSTPEPVGFTIARTLAGDVLDVPQYEGDAVATAPLGYWRVGEPSGTVAADVMGAYDGTYVNAPTLGAAGLLTGDPDTAMTGNGTNSHLLTPTLPAMAAWSVMFWAKSNGAGLTYDPYFSTPGVTFICARSTDAKLVVYCGGWLTLTLADFIAATPTCILLTYDAATGLTVYGNGIQVYNNGPSVGVALPNSALYFGYSPALGQATGDTMDEPIVWDRRLSDPEAAALYAAGTTLPPIVTPAERVTVNNYARTAKLGGATNLRGDMTLLAGNRHGEYLRLIPGSNTLRILGAPAECRISFFPTWS